MCQAPTRGCVILIQLTWANLETAVAGLELGSHLEAKNKLEEITLQLGDYMRALISILSVASALLSGCSDSRQDAIPTDTASTDTASVPLSIYVVSAAKIEGGKYFDTPDFPKLGYIAD